MRIFINDDEFQFSGNTINDMLAEYGFNGSAGIALAVNETVVLKNTWATYELRENDSILLITPAQGG